MSQVPQDSSLHPNLGNNNTSSSGLPLAAASSEHLPPKKPPDMPMVSTSRPDVITEISHSFAMSPTSEQLGQEKSAGSPPVSATRDGVFAELSRAFAVASSEQPQREKVHDLPKVLEPRGTDLEGISRAFAANSNSEGMLPEKPQLSAADDVISQAFAAASSAIPIVLAQKRVPVTVTEALPIAPRGAPSSAKATDSEFVHTNSGFLKPVRRVGSPHIFSPRTVPFSARISGAPASISARQRLIYGPNFGIDKRIGSVQDGVSKIEPTAESSLEPVSSDSAFFDDADNTSDPYYKKAVKKRKIPLKEQLSVKMKDTGKIPPPVNAKKPKKRKAPMEIPTRNVKSKTTQKDTAFARATLADKIELSKVISQDDSFFLAKNFWIFTLQQLEHMLPCDEDANNPDCKSRAEKFRLEIAQRKVAAREDDNSIAGKTDGTEGVDPEEAKKTNPIISSAVTDVSQSHEAITKAPEEKGVATTSSVDADADNAKQDSSRKTDGTETVDREEAKKMSPIISSAVTDVSQSHEAITKASEEKGVATTSSVDADADNAKQDSSPNGDNARDERPELIEASDMSQQTVVLASEEDNIGTYFPIGNSPTGANQDASSALEEKPKFSKTSSDTSQDSDTNLKEDAAASPMDIETPGFSKETGLQAPREKVSDDAVPIKADATNINEEASSTSEPALDKKPQLNEASNSQTKAKSGDVNSEPRAISGVDAAENQPSEITAATTASQGHPAPKAADTLVTSNAATPNRTAGTDKGDVTVHTAPAPDLNRDSNDGKGRSAPAIPVKVLREVDAQILKWQAQARRWREEASSQSDANNVEERFPLDGPIKVLFPEVIVRFLKSISIGNLFEFLSVRKTEQSPFIAALYLWRKHCSLPELKRICLSRHISGIAVRIEKAVKSVPPLDSFARKWMGTVLVCLTGASREYLVDECGCVDPEHFIDTQTKIWSDRLVIWRRSRGMSELKGSGKVAMVSGWKTSMKESLDAEKGLGEIVTEASFLKPVEDANKEEDSVDDVTSTEDLPLVVAPVRAMSPKTKLKESWAMEPEFECSDFLRDALREENASFLSSVGIQNGRQLMEASKTPSSPFIRDLILFRSRMTKSQAQAHSCVRLSYDWIRKLRKHVEPYRAALAGKKATKEDANVNKERNVRKRKRMQTSSAGHKDPTIAALSDTTRAFLDTTDITSGQELLSTKTSVIAKAYVRWRAKMGMSTLKGDGAIATVSSWKAIVRKEAAKMGNREISVTVFRQPLITQKEKRESQQSKSQRPLVRTPPITCDELSHPHTLLGHSQRSFCVQSSSEPQTLYHFELSIRRSSSLKPQDLSLFMTYKFCSNNVEFSGVRGPKRLAERSKEAKHNSLFRPILTDIPVAPDMVYAKSTLEPFSSYLPGCGLIEVGRYGALPFTSIGTNRASELARSLKQFVFHRGSDKESKHPAWGTIGSEEIPRIQTGDSKCNVFLQEGSLGALYLLHITEPMQAGQIVELKFDSKSNTRNFSPDNSTGALARVAISQHISMLSMKESKELIELISGMFDSLNKVMLHDTSDGSPHEDKKVHLLSRRRVHWLATRLMSHLNGGIAPIDPGCNKEELALLLENVRRFFLHPELLRHLVSGQPEPTVEALKEEISEEIKAEMVLNGSQFRDSLSCPSTASLLKRCLSLASQHVIYGTADSLSSQQSLLAEFQCCVKDYTAAVLSKEKEAVSFAFESPPSWKYLTGDEEKFLWEDSSSLPASIAANLASCEAYNDVMLICGEPSYSMEVKKAMFASPNSPGIVYAYARHPYRPATLPRCLADFKSSQFALDEVWYIQNQILSTVLDVATVFDWADSPTEPGKKLFSYDILLEGAKAQIQACGDEEVRKRFDMIKEPPRAPYICALEPVAPYDDANPKSLPLFLGIVWPLLRSSFGWSTSAGETPEDVVFLAPGEKKRKQSKQKKKLKTEVFKKRVKIEKRVAEVGLGNVQKLAKRLFIMCAEDGLVASSQSLAVEAIKQFVREVLSESSAENIEECQRRADAIADALSVCFDEMKGSLVCDREQGAGDSTDVNMNGCEYLLRMILLLPNILQQAGLPNDQLEATLSTIKDLCRYLAGHAGDLFEERNQPCHEAYVVGHEQAKPFVSAKMREIASQSLVTSGTSLEATDPSAVKTENDDVIRELVLHEDTADLTEYTATTMRQMLPCRATAIDLGRKSRSNVPIGFPGLMCRHCLGAPAGEGKYFFTTLGSLNTASNVAFSHMLRCPKVPEETKTTLMQLKQKHAAEMKQIKFGAQARYFKRLHGRLFSSSSAIESSGGVVLFSPEAQEPEVETAVPIVASNGSQTEFKSHIELLRYLQTASPWKDKQEVKACLDAYFKCLDYGGRLYHTTAMPQNFGAEYILSKLVTQPLTLKRHYSIG